LAGQKSTRLGEEGRSSVEDHVFFQIPDLGRNKEKQDLGGQLISLCFSPSISCLVLQLLQTLGIFFPYVLSNSRFLGIHEEKACWVPLSLSRADFQCPSITPGVRLRQFPFEMLFRGSWSCPSRDFLVMTNLFIYCWFT